MQSEYIEGEDIGEAEVYNDDGVCNQDIFENMQLEEVIWKKIFSKIKHM